MNPEEGHFRPLWVILGARGLIEDTFLFEGRWCIPLPPRCAPVYNLQQDVKFSLEIFLLTVLLQKIELVSLPAMESPLLNFSLAHTRFTARLQMAPALLLTFLSASSTSDGSSDAGRRMVHFKSISCYWDKLRHCKGIRHCMLSWWIHPRTKIRRTRLTKIRLGDENFPD